MLFRWGLQKAASGSPLTGIRLDAFHAAGGQDVRDGFDYIFERQRGEREYIALVEADGPGGVQRYAGTYGNRSYHGTSPRPHDLYLEEMWDIADDGSLTKRTPSEGAWFAAAGIRNVHFRDLPTQERETGRTRTLGTRSIQQALREGRRHVARQLFERCEALYPDGIAGDPQPELEVSMRRVVEAVEHADLQGLDGREAEARWDRAREELAEFGTFATALIRDEDFAQSARDLAWLAERGRLDVRVDMIPPHLWLAVFEQVARRLANAPPERRDEVFGRLIALVVDGLFDIDNFDWDHHQPH